MGLLAAALLAGAEHAVAASLQGPAAAVCRPAAPFSVGSGDAAAEADGRPEPSRSGPAVEVTLDSYSELIVIDRASGTLNLLERRTGGLDGTLARGGPVSAAAFDQATDLLYVARGAKVTAIDVGRRAQVGQLDLGAPVQGLALSADGRLFSLDASGEIVVTGAVGLTAMGRLPGRVCSHPVGLAFTPDTDTLEVACSDGGLRTVSSETGEPVEVGPEPAGLAAATPARSADGLMAATC